MGLEADLPEGPGRGPLGETKGTSGRPPNRSTLRLRPPRSPHWASISVPFPTSPTGQPCLHRQNLLRPKTNPPAGAHPPGPGPRPLGPRLWLRLSREFGALPASAGAQLRAWGSYPAVGGPRRHPPPGPRHLRTRPRLLAAALGLGVPLLPPCSAARTRLSGTVARKGQRGTTPGLALDPPPVSMVPPPAASLQATPPRLIHRKTGLRNPPSCLVLGAQHFKPRPQSPSPQAPPPEPSLSASFPTFRLWPRLRARRPRPQRRLAGPRQSPQLLTLRPLPEGGAAASVHSRSRTVLALALAAGPVLNCGRTVAVTGTLPAGRSGVPTWIGSRGKQDTSRALLGRPRAAELAANRYMDRQTRHRRA